MKSLVTIVGMKHRGAEKLVASLPRGEPLTLVREPKNDYDQNAVQVWARDQHIGYVKGTQARDVARFMDSGKIDLWPATLAVTADRWPNAEFNTTAVSELAQPSLPLPKPQKKPTAPRAVKEGWKHG